MQVYTMHQRKEIAIKVKLAITDKSAIASTEQNKKQANSSSWNEMGIKLKPFI